MKCRYEVDEFCTNELCPMRGDYCPVPDTDGVCRHEFREEERWELTPRGCFSAALSNHIKLDEDIADFIWKDFADLMKQFGYAKDDTE